MIRLAPPGTDAQRQVRLTRWLRAEGFAVAAPIADAAVIAGIPVSLWEYVESDGRPIDFERLGEFAARLHALPVERLAGIVALPFCGDAAWLAIERRLLDVEAAAVLHGAELAALHTAWRRLQDWQDRARSESQVVCHGDLHPQNVLMRGPEVMIIDWDAVCTGPAAWDHAALIPWAQRYGGPPDAYPDFARGYGADLRGTALAEVRLLAATINAILMAAHDPSVITEAHTRLRYWLGDRDAATWTSL